jgi:hypothetical protein
LTERGIRFAFCTAKPVELFPDDFKTATTIVKPFTEDAVQTVLKAAAPC